MAAMAVCVNIAEWIGDQTLVGKVFIHRRAISSMTFGTTILPCMDAMPFTIFIDLILLNMTGITR
jgi:hypothetical protein